MAGHDHTDGGKHDHTAGANSRQLTIALGLTGAFLVAEIIGGLYFNSLALLSDAAHMFTDAAALGIALLAIKIGQRAADDKRTFGYRRFEILAAAFNAVLLFLVAGYVLYEGIKRIFDPVNKSPRYSGFSEEKILGIEGLDPASEDHRRVLAVLAYLRDAGPSTPEMSQTSD